MRKVLLSNVAMATLLSINANASMLDQVIYNVVGQVSNAIGARLGDEIYYGSSSGRPARVVHHRRHRKHRKHTKHKKVVTQKKKAPVVKKLSFTPQMKIQTALVALGFYNGRIDGEVNSYETRSAIKELNKKFGISNSASLKPEEKDALIYLGTLFKFDRNLIAKGSNKITKGKKLQTALKIHGVYNSKIDGLIGSGTKKAIIAYKEKYNLSSGSKLDFEEEYQLISSAKKKNESNIEETIASLKALGTSNVAQYNQNIQANQQAMQQMQPQKVNQVVYKPANSMNNQNQMQPQMQRVQPNVSPTMSQPTTPAPQNIPNSATPAQKIQTNNTSFANKTNITNQNTSSSMPNKAIEKSSTLTVIKEPTNTKEMEKVNINKQVTQNNAQTTLEQNKSKNATTLNSSNKEQLTDSNNTQKIVIKADN